MDLVTQALVGAVAGGATRSLIRQPELPAEVPAEVPAEISTKDATNRTAALRAAALTGALAALLADADVLLGNPADPIIAQELHRHFSHALLFVPVGAALVTALLARPLRRHLAMAPRFAAAAAGLLTAGLLDACTGFGTHLLWPFSDARTAWNLVSIIDPAFTLLALLPLLLALRSGRAGALLLALALLLAYLLLALVQQQRAMTAGASAAEARGEVPQRQLVRPSFGNILLWRSVYLAGGAWQADAVRLGPTSVCVYPGDRAPALQVLGSGGSEAPSGPVTEALPEWLPPDAARRLARLTDDVLVLDTSAQQIGDGRFAMLPDSMAPIWGLRASTTEAVTATQDPELDARKVRIREQRAVEDAQSDGSALQWFTDRTLTPAMRSRFIAMLLGNDPDCRR